MVFWGGLSVRFDEWGDGLIFVIGVGVRCVDMIDVCVFILVGCCDNVVFVDVIGGLSDIVNEFFMVCDFYGEVEFFLGLGVVEGSGDYVVWVVEFDGIYSSDN